MRAIAITAFATLALAACSPADRAEVKEDAQAVAADVKKSAQDIGASEAMSDLKAGA